MLHPQAHLPLVVRECGSEFKLKPAAQHQQQLRDKGLEMRSRRAVALSELVLSVRKICNSQSLRDTD